MLATARCGQNYIMCSFWACPCVKLFWRTVTRYATDHLVNYVTLTWSWVRFAFLELSEVKITVGGRKWLTIISIIVKKGIHHKWIYPNPPSLKPFGNKLMFFPNGLKQLFGCVAMVNWYFINFNNQKIISFALTSWYTLRTLGPSLSLL